MALTFNADGGGSASFADLAISAQGSVGQYWIDQNYGGPMYEVEKRKAPGSNGHKIKRHGFDRRTMTFEVMIISASASGCRTARTTIEDALKDDNVSVAVSGGPTFSNCNIIDVRKLKGPRITETGNYRYHIQIVAEEVRV